MASNRIKGITIELDGDTRGLDKALSEVNSKSIKLQKELKDVNGLLKFNPGNTELIAQKQKLLGDQIETTSEKLKKLKAAQADVNEQFKNGNISEEQYRAFQREIVETESKLKNLKQQLKETRDETKSLGKYMEETGQKMQKAGDKMMSAGKGITTKVTVPILGVAAASAKVGMDFEAAMSQVAAVSGATGSDLEKLEAKARKMGAATQFSAAEAADALYYMSLAGWDTNQMLDGLDGMLALAAASGEDLGKTSDIVTDGLSAFGLKASDSARFADVLAAASSNANTDVAGLGEAFKYAAPVAGALGFTIEDTSKAISLMANSGIKASQAGTALRTMMANLAKPTNQMQMEMDRLGISLTDSRGNMLSLDEIMLQMRSSFSKLSEAQQAQSASAIFGKEAMSGALAIINTSKEDYDKLTGAIAGSEGAAQAMADVMNDNLAGRLKALKSAVEEMAIILFENMQPALEAMVAALTTAAQWFGALPAPIQQLIIVIAAIAAAIGPVVMILGVFLKNLGIVVAVVGKVIGAASALGSAFVALTGPVGIIVLAVGAIIAIGVALYKNWDTIKAKAQELWPAISETMKQVGGVIVKTWVGILKFLTGINLFTIGVNMIKGLINGMLGMDGSLKGAIKGMVSGAIEGAKKVLGIASPSKVFTEIGEFTGEGLEKGLMSMSGRVARASDRMTQGTIVDAPEFGGPNTPRPSQDQPQGGTGGAGAININIGTMTVRNDEDIQKISRELYALMEREKRGKGGGI